MNQTGFQILRLALSGIGVETAEIIFESGLNLITGPSDTGKTFILQCIDYMLGGSNVPKSIPEAESYDTVILEIKKTSDDKVFTLQRSIKKAGQFTLFIDGEESCILKSKHDKESEDNISYFLLDTLGLTGKEIRKNSRDEKLSLSFRNIARLCIVSEEDVIKETSPVVSGIVTAKTVEKSVFSLLLSGIDDSELVAIEDPKISKARINAKIEMLNELIEQTRDELEELNIQSEANELRGQLERLNNSYNQSCEQISMIEASTTEKEEERQEIWKRLRGIESRLNVLSGLNERFTLLDTQYTSDLGRLNAIAEVSQRINQMSPEWCPVCGSPADCHNKEHQEVQIDPVLVAKSCVAETASIKLLRGDLDSTRTDIASEIQELSNEYASKQEYLSEIEHDISGYFKPRIQAAVQKSRDIQRKQEYIKSGIELFERIDKLEKLIDAFEGESKNLPKADGEQSGIVSEIETLCLEIEKRIKAWQCPEMDRVTFNYDSKIWDIIISGRERSSHGKGVRALTHAAFTLGLLQYCISQKMPHPGFVVIDSPLVVYREPDSDEGEYSQHVKTLFLKDVATTYASEQIIILENMEPPSFGDGECKINNIQFTKSRSHGRFGFIPVSNDSSIAKEDENT